MTTKRIMVAQRDQFMRARDENAFPVRYFWEMEVVS